MNPPPGLGDRPGTTFNMTKMKHNLTPADLERGKQAEAILEECHRKLVALGQGNGGLPVYLMVMETPDGIVAWDNGARHPVGFRLILDITATWAMQAHQKLEGKEHAN